LSRYVKKQHIHLGEEVVKFSGTNNFPESHAQHYRSRRILDHPFVFILGASRSGTTWLQSILSEHPHVCTYPELKLFSHYLKPWFNAWKWDEQDTAPHGLPAIWSRDEFYDFMREFLARIYGRVAESAVADAIIVDKIPQSNDIELIETLLPGPKYIHVIRDGRDVASSLIAASKGWGKAWAPSTVPSAAKWWRFGVNNARVAKRYQNEGRYIEVHYEEMLTDNLVVINKIIDFLGFDRKNFDVAAIVERNRIENMKKRENFLDNFSLPSDFIRKGQSGEWNEKWSVLDRFKFHLIAGNLLLECDYADSYWWVKKSYQRWWIPLQVRFGPRKIIRKILKKLNLAA
jgi:hypothetical protein